MAGHSQFKNIMHRKGAQDAKKSKIFTKIIRELTISAKLSGGDPESPRLRTALFNARKANIPKETMTRAIKKASSPENEAHYQEMRYEGYGPGGVALIVETLTDNRNRTTPEIRLIFNKYGGTLGESNSVNFLFEHMGLITYPQEMSLEKIFEKSVSAGAQDVRIWGEKIHVLSTIEELARVRDILMQGIGEPEQIGLGWIPKISMTITQIEIANPLRKLVESLEDHDDVQTIWGNYEFSADLLQELCP